MFYLHLSSHRFDLSIFLLYFSFEPSSTFPVFVPSVCVHQVLRQWCFQVPQTYSRKEFIFLFSILRVWPPPLRVRSWRETVPMSWSPLKELQSMWSLPGSLLEGCSVWCGSRPSSASLPLELNFRKGTSPALTMWIIFPYSAFTPLFYCQNRDMRVKYFMALLTPAVLGHHPNCCRRGNWLLWLLPRV